MSVILILSLWNICHQLSYRKTDIAIIGQGLAGSLLARELWHQGVDFIVIDRGHEHSASLAAGGLFYPLAARKLKEVDLGAEQFAQMIKTFQEVQAELKINILHEIPSLKLLMPGDLPQWQQAAEENLSQIIREIHPRVNLKGVKSGLSGAIIIHSGFVDLPLFLHKMRGWLLSRQLLFELDAMPIIAKDKFIINDFLQAEKIILCEGPAILSNPDLSMIDIRLSKGEWIEIFAPGLDDGYIIRSDIFILPLGYSHFRVGATFSHDATHTEPSEWGLAELIRKLEKMVDVPYTITGHKAGFRPTTRDRNPVVGAIPLQPNIYLFNGLGSRGVFQAPWYARQLARYILTGEKGWPKTSDTARFF